MPEPGDLVPQPHGGAIKQGGNPGNKGGRGRPPEAFRKLARKVIATRDLLPRLGDIAEGKATETIECPNCGTIAKTSPLREQRGAIDTLLKVGVGVERGIKASVVQQKLERTIQVVEELPPDISKPLLAKLATIWKGE